MPSGERATRQGCNAVRVRLAIASLMLCGAVAVTALVATTFGSPAEEASANNAGSFDAAVPQGDATAPPPAEVVLEPKARIVLHNPETWSTASRDNVLAALSLLPNEVLAQLGNPALGPVHVLVNDEGRTFSGQQPYGRAANFYSTNEGRNELVLFPEQGVETVLHELGHAYNLRRVPAGSYARVLLDQEMRSFMDAAGWRILTPEAVLALLTDHTQVQATNDTLSIWSLLSRGDPLEDFACSFALYFLEPQELERLSLARFAWFVSRFAGLKPAGQGAQ